MMQHQGPARVFDSEDDATAAIMAGRFAPGERLSEPLLAQELGVSRTPVREALMRLAEEGLVELVPGRGARVRVFAPEEVEEV